MAPGPSCLNKKLVHSSRVVSNTYSVSVWLMLKIMVHLPCCSRWLRGTYYACNTLQEYITIETYEHSPFRYSKNKTQSNPRIHTHNQLPALLGKHAKYPSMIIMFNGSSKNTTERNFHPIRGQQDTTSLSGLINDWFIAWYSWSFCMYHANKPQEKQPGK